MSCNALARIWSTGIGVILAWGLVGSAHAQEALDVSNVVLPEIEVVQTTPSPGSAAPQDKIFLRV